MNVALKKKENTEIGIHFANKAEDFSAIHLPENEAVIWQRRSLQVFQSWIDSLDPAQLPNARIILRPDDVRDAVVQACEAANMPHGAERDWLIDDVTRLADVFSNVLNANWLRLRFDVVNTNACTKFHIDAVVARLLCTYRGTGTQYGASNDGAEPYQIFTAPTGDPILLRGTAWPKYTKSDLLHRSPPIEGTGETRLLLVLDKLIDPHDEY